MGQRLRKRAQEIVELADKTRQEFAVPTGEVAGDIYIGGGETHVMRYIAQTAVACAANIRIFAFICTAATRTTFWSV